MSNIISNLKSFFKTKTGLIDEDQAHDIQRKHLLMSTKKAKSKLVYTKPYLLIEKQITDKSHQVAKAAVYNIALIAKNIKKYRKDILDLFDKHLNSKKTTEELKDYITQQVKDIKKAP